MTAARYAGIVRLLGARASIVRNFSGQDFDVLVALNARKSGASALRFRAAFPDRPLVIVMTGTDLYRDIGTSVAACRAMEAASALVTLQPLGASELPHHLRSKTAWIIQSAAVTCRRRRKRSHFQVCVLGHLRSEKDPLRTAYALRQIPATLDVRVVQAGAPLEHRYAVALKAEASKDARYRWAGDLPRPAALRLLCESDVMVISSRMEGGANVVCEALAARVPVIASNIPGNVGLLGSDYPGLYPVGDSKALASVISRAVEDRPFYLLLKRKCSSLRGLVSPTFELLAWKRLLRRLVDQTAR